MFHQLTKKGVVKCCMLEAMLDSTIKIKQLLYLNLNLGKELDTLKQRLQTQIDDHLLHHGTRNCTSKCLM